MSMYPDYDLNPPPEDEEEAAGRRFRVGCLFMIFAYAIFLAVLGLVVNLFTATPAKPHDAPLGWSYDYSCCNTRDCRQVSGPASKSKVTVSEVKGGYQVNRVGAEPEFLRYNDSRIKQSKDGEYHWCSGMDGADDSYTICLYVPPRNL